jgi:hypothetical protein
VDKEEKNNRTQHRHWQKRKVRSRISFLARILESFMNFSQMKDQRLLAFYENVRQQVALDTGSRYRFAGDGVRAYADKLSEEMDRRRLGFTPIDWPATKGDNGS